MDYLKFVFKSDQLVSSSSFVNGIEEINYSDTFVDNPFVQLNDAGNYFFDFPVFFDYFDPNLPFHIVIEDSRVTSFANFDWGYVDSPSYNMSLFSTVGNLFYSNDALDLFLNTPPAPPVVGLPSLNGNGCEFLDSTQVKVIGRSIVYTVARSYMGLVSDNSYTALYDCVATSGESLTVPEALLTRYIAPVTTP